LSSSLCVLLLQQSHVAASGPLIVPYRRLLAAHAEELPNSFKLLRDHRTGTRSPYFGLRRSSSAVTSGVTTRPALLYFVRDGRRGALTYLICMI
jgi:hypothetical protein